jgi:hypothetical protein
MSRFKSLRRVPGEQRGSPGRPVVFDLGKPRRKPGLNGLLLGGLLLAVSGIAQGQVTIIDDWTTGSDTTASGSAPVTAVDNVTSPTGILGTERDIIVTKTSDSTDNASEVNARVSASLATLSHNEDNNAAGRTVIQWDGTADSPKEVLDDSGLGADNAGADLEIACAAGGGFSFNVEGGSGGLETDTDITLRVWSDGGTNNDNSTKTIPAVPGSVPRQIKFPFSDFGSSVTFSDVSAVELEIDPSGTATDLEISSPFTSCPFDFGDAPNSYTTIIGSDGPHHVATSDLHLGTNPGDSDFDGFAGGTEVASGRAVDDDLELSTFDSDGSGDQDRFEVTFTGGTDNDGDGIDDRFDDDQLSGGSNTDTGALTGAEINGIDDFVEATGDNETNGIADGFDPKYTTEFGTSFRTAVNKLDNGTFSGTANNEIDDNFELFDNATAGTVDDEDGPSFPNIGDNVTVSSGDIYTVTLDTNNSTGENATLCGWIDFNDDGDFDNTDTNAATTNAERECVTVTDGDTSADLDFRVPNDFVLDGGEDEEYLSRFRITRDADFVANPTPSGFVTDGEVEDHTIETASLPITLASVEAWRTGGGLQVTWTTATESGNAGFHLYGRAHGGSWQRLTGSMIPSKVVDSRTPQRYEAYFPSPGVDVIRIEDWSIRGESVRHGPFELGQRHGADAVEQARSIPWQRIRATNAADRSFRGSPRTLRSRARASHSAASAGSPEALLWVTKPGVQRIGVDTLRSEGVDFTGVPVADLALTDDGEPQPRHIIDANGDGVLNSGDAVEFRGTVTPTLYSDRNAYHLRVDPTKAQAVRDGRGRARRARRMNRDLGRTLPDTVTLDQQRRYFVGAPGDDPWYDAQLYANNGSARLERTFDLPGYAGGGATLALSLWGITDWPGSEPDHHVIVSVNGQRIDAFWFDGHEDASRDFQLPAGLLQAEGNTITLEAPGDTGFAFEIQAFDGIAVTYDRQTRAHEGSWQGTLSERGRWGRPAGHTGYGVVNLEGFSGEVVAWNHRLRLVGTDRLRIRGGGDWFAADHRAIQEPTVEAPVPAPAATTRAADYVIIAHPQFLDADALDELVMLQENRGYRTEVVDVDSIYAGYSDFAVDAEAIRQYLAEVQPDFVLLVGGDTYDYQDYLDVESESFIPTHYVSTDGQVTFAPADIPHVDYTGDGLPQAAIGRLPVRTRGELEQLVRKLRNYQTPNRGLFSAGRSDRDEAFSQVSANYASTLSKKGWMTDTIHVDEAGLEDAKTRLLDELNIGGTLVSYVGHSSHGIWGLNPQTGVLFDTKEARELTNSQPHVVTQWGCWNTYFVHPTTETMANTLLFQDGGAAAVMGATALTDLGLLQGLGENFFEQMANEPTLGEALLAAQRQYAGERPGVVDQLRGFVLLGDPATPLSRY